MRLYFIASVLCTCTWLAAADVAHLKLKKARSNGRHHKRGVYSAVPTYKLGHDIPSVTHSVVKPVIVSYPPTASVTAVKVPITRPHTPQFPVTHKSPIHKLFGHKFPHGTKTLVPSPDQHFHHHHHHVAPRPVLPAFHPPAPAIPPTPIVPIAQPNTPVAGHPLPAPSPSLFIQNDPAPATVPVPILPQAQVHLKPAFQAAQLPLSPAPVFPAPVVPFASQYPYIIRPGNAVQTSYFATYPRYPLLNYQSPLIPLATPSAPAPVTQLFLDNPPHPQYHLLPRPNVHNGVFEDSGHGVAVDQSPTLLHSSQALIPQTPVHLHPDIHLQANPEVHLHAQPEVHLQPQPEVHSHQSDLHLHPQPDIHLQSAQPAVHVDNDGWSPVPVRPLDHPATEIHQYPESHEGHLFTQEQGTQVFEHHSNEQQYRDLHQLQHHIQQQIEHAQYDQHLNNHNLNPDYITQQEVEHQQHANHNYDQHDDFHRDQESGLRPQPTQEYGLPGHLGQEYGAPHPGFEGRSEGGEEDSQQHQLYHNHIPLGLQPPLDRPLEHFR